MSQPLVSVIIPIYKVEEFLPDCLESVIHQTYSDLEIICVNDGSPDRCEDILKDYAMLDRRIKVINKVNGGLSSARNAALPVAQGEYVFFLDSDDWLSLDCIENLVKDMLRSKADIACVHDILSISRDESIGSGCFPGMSPALLKLPTKYLNNCGWWPGESFTAARRCLIWG